MMFGAKPELLDRVPEFATPTARAWVVDVERYREKLSISADRDATVRQWVIEAPWAHPLWHSYWIALQNLKPLPGLPDPRMYVDGATHEFVLYALNPEHGRLGFIVGDDAPRYLSPANFAAQFIADSDEAAIARMEAAIGMILDGKLSPDTDFLSQWVALFGDGMVRPEFRPTG